MVVCVRVWTTLRNDFFKPLLNSVLIDMTLALTREYKSSSIWFYYFLFFFLPRNHAVKLLTKLLGWANVGYLALLGST